MQAANSNSRAYGIEFYDSNNNVYLISGIIKYNSNYYLAIVGFSASTGS
jgi:hypothetical protein